MKKILVFALVLAGVALSACSKNVTVSAPVISPMDFASQGKTKGNYAIMVQSGAWHVEVKAAGWTCSAFEFPTDFETAYNSSVKSAMQQNFENVTFTPTSLKPEELKAQGYDAQIIVYEGSIAGNFSVSPNLFTATINADVAMQGIVAVLDLNGKVHQGNAQGTGKGSAETAMGCGVTATAINVAGGAAIRDYVLNAVNAAKLNVLEIKSERFENKGVPSS